MSFISMACICAVDKAFIWLAVKALICLALSATICSVPSPVMSEVSMYTIWVFFKPAMLAVPKSRICWLLKATI